MNDERKQFIIAWKESPAAQLMISDPSTDTLELGKESGWLASVVLLAWHRNLLPRLDGLVNEFQIPSRGTSEFKGALRENWLEKIEDRRRNVVNQTMAAIAELTVADYVRGEGERIQDLGAWTQGTTDITSTKGDNHVYTEVKYFSDSPEEYDIRIRAAKGNNATADWLTTDEQTLNYFFYRLAQAVMQLTTHDLQSRRVWFVFDATADFIGRDTLESNFDSFTVWHRDNNGDYPGILDETVIKKTPTQWLSEAHELVISTLDRFQLTNVEIKHSE